MKNKIELNELKSGMLEFNFLNGTIYLDETRFGAYAICPGCGSGKTTIVKQLIGLKWHEGILYSAFTRDEVNLMYNWIVNNLVDKEDPLTGRTLRLDDIIVLHSDYTAAGTDKDLWLNRPREIANKKIVLCTHAKLLDEPLHLLVASNFNQPLSDVIGPLAASVIGGSNSLLPRQWILIDESTEAKSEKFKVSKSMIMALGTLSDRVNNVSRVDPTTGRIIYSSSLLPKPRIVRNINYYKDFCNLLDTLSEYSPSTFLNQLRTEKTELDKIRNDQFRQSFFTKFNELSFEKSEVARVCFSFTDLIRQGMLTHVLLLDGTSDITLSKSNKLEVLSYDNKYSSPVKLSLFSFYGLDRKVKVDKSVPDIDFYIKDKVNNIVDQLETIIRSNEKTLIFTWMDLKKSEVEENDDLPEFDQSNYSSEPKDIKLASEVTDIKVNSNQYFYKYIQHKLEDRGLVNGVNFSIEYYGSGKDKAINDYRDYDAVVLAGSYHVPNSVISDFNLMFGTNMSGTEYYSNRAIQAICRTRIRKHEGEPINVYISSDWSGDTINYIKRYLNVPGFENVVNDEVKNDIEYMYNELRRIKVSPKKAEQIAKLSTLDQNIFRAIVNGTNYSTDLKLDDVFNTLPVSRKDAHKYSYLTNHLKENYRIIINII